MFKSHQLNKYQGSVSLLSASLKTAEQCLCHLEDAEMELRDSSMQFSSLSAPEALPDSPVHVPPSLRLVPPSLEMALPCGTRTCALTCSCVPVQCSHITSLKVSQTQWHFKLFWVKGVLNYHVWLWLNLNLQLGVKGACAQWVHCVCPQQLASRHTQIPPNPLPDFKTVTGVGCTVLHICVDHYYLSYQLLGGIWFSHLHLLCWAIFPWEKWVWVLFALKSWRHNSLLAKAVWKWPSSPFRDKFKLWHN